MHELVINSWTAFTFRKVFEGPVVPKVRGEEEWQRKGLLLGKKGADVGGKPFSCQGQATIEKSSKDKKL